MRLYTKTIWKKVKNNDLRKSNIEDIKFDNDSTYKSSAIFKILSRLRFDVDLIKMEGFIKFSIVTNKRIGKRMTKKIVGHLSELLWNFYLGKEVRRKYRFQVDHGNVFELENLKSIYGYKMCFKLRNNDCVDQFINDMIHLKLESVMEFQDSNIIVKQQPSRDLEFNFKYDSLLPNGYDSEVIKIISGKIYHVVTFNGIYYPHMRYKVIGFDIHIWCNITYYKLQVEKNIVDIQLHYNTKIKYEIMKIYKEDPSFMTYNWIWFNDMLISDKSVTIYAF